MKYAAKLVADETRSALHSFAELDLAAWHGLPEHCSVHEARRLFALDDAIEGRSTLGTNCVPTSYQSLEDRPLRIWQRENTVVLLDYEGPFETLQIERLLGPPTHKNSVHWGYTVLPEGEWLYPQRGLASIVLSTGVIARLFGFLPADNVYFSETLRPCMTNRPLRKKS